MATTPLVSSGTGTPAATVLTGGTDVNATAEDRFLTLLVKQLQNQDPLNPMDNAELTSQIAQINTVKGIDKLNVSFGDMSQSMLAAQSLQAASMIGRGVVAEGGSVDWDGREAPMSFDLKERAQVVTVDVIDPATRGTVYSAQIRNPDGSPIEPGMSAFAWHGETSAGPVAASGRYEFKVQALSADGKSVGLTSYGFAKVDSVSLDGGVKVNTGALGTLPMSAVKEIL